MKTKLYYLVLILMSCCSCAGKLSQPSHDISDDCYAKEGQAQSSRYRIEPSYLLKNPNGGIMGWVYEIEGKTIVLNSRGGVTVY